MLLHSYGSPNTPACTLSFCPSPHHSALHPITLPFTLCPSPYYSALHPITPPFTPHSTLYPIPRPFTISLHTRPYQSTHHKPSCRNIRRCRTQPEALRNNHCISPCSPNHSAMTDEFLACIALSKHIPWQAVASIDVHQFAPISNIAHQILTVLLWLH